MLLVYLWLTLWAVWAVTSAVDMLLVYLCYFWLTLWAVCGLLKLILSQSAERVTTRQKLANDRAMRLLELWMSEAQRLALPRGSFPVIGSHSGRVYRIRVTAESFNVYALYWDSVNGRWQIWCRYCFAPAADVPLGDRLLAQKLALETDEYTTIMMANRVNSCEELNRRTLEAGRECDPVERRRRMEALL